MASPAPMTPTESSADARVTRSWSLRNSPRSAPPGVARRFGPGPSCAGPAARYLGAVHRGLLHAGAHPQQHDGRHRAQPEHDAPGEFRRRQAEDEGVGDQDAGVTDRPGALDRPDDSPALRRLGVLRHEHRARGPLAAKAEALQREENQQLLVGLCAAGQEREDRVRCNGEDQHPHASDRVGQRPGQRAAHRARHHADTPEQPRLRGGERKRGRHSGQDETHGHLVVGVERPATEGRPERGATRRGKRPVPVQVRVEPGEHTGGRRGRQRLHQVLPSASKPCRSGDTPWRKPITARAASGRRPSYRNG